MQTKAVARKASGRVTPKKGSPAASAKAAKPARSERWDLDDSRTVRSGWIWRGFLVLSLFAVGVALILNGNHHSDLAVVWLVIAAGWFGFSMFLWRRHTRWVRGS